MTKIYVITDGDYSDYHIVAIFSDQARANEISERSGMYLEEHELDPETPGMNSGLIPYTVYMDYNGSSGTPETCLNPLIGLEKDEIDFSPPEYSPTSIAFFEATVLARTPKHTVKICNEYRTRWIALNQWTPDGRILPPEASEASHHSLRVLLEKEQRQTKKQAEKENTDGTKD